MVAAGEAIAGSGTASVRVNHPPSNLRPERKSPASIQTEADDPTSLDRAVWEDGGTLDWVLRLTNDMPLLRSGTSVQVDVIQKLVVILQLYAPGFRVMHYNTIFTS